MPKWNTDSSCQTAQLNAVHGIGHPVLNANGEFVEIIGTTVDITERKRAEEERARLPGSKPISRTSTG